MKSVTDKKKQLSKATGSKVVAYRETITGYYAVTVNKKGKTKTEFVDHSEL